MELAAAFKGFGRGQAGSARVWRIGNFRFGLAAGQEKISIGF
jgi:hypothetical protein